LISSIKNSVGLGEMNEDVATDVRTPEPESNVASETFDEPKLKSKRTKKKSKSKRRKHRHRSPSTSSSSSSSSSSSKSSSDSGSSEDDKKSLKKIKKKMKKKLKRKLQRRKENIQPPTMMMPMPMMMPINYQQYPGMNNNFAASPFNQFPAPHPSGSGQVLSQITATVAKSANPSLVRDEFI